MKLYKKITLGIILVVALGGGFYFFTTKNKSVSCTQEAKLCPDGSYVGRTGPNCEFAKCTEVNPNDVKSGISGSVLLGPICPAERIPPDPRCAAKPYQTNFAVTTPDGTQVIKEFSSDANGKFKVNLLPGNYLIRPIVINTLPRCANNNIITVQADAYTDIVINCDTGIR